MELRDKRVWLIGASSGSEIAYERLILLDSATAEVTFPNVAEQPLLPINRDFSAPVILYAALQPGGLDR